MNEETMRGLLGRVQTGALDVDAALHELQASHVGTAPDIACVDLDRPRRCGMPEAIFCEGKEPGAVAAIAARIVESGQSLLATRASGACYAAVRELVPGAVYHERARVIARRHADAPAPVGRIAVVSAGTSDVPVAEEARVTAETLGSRVETFYDIGVAGVHRLLAHRDELNRARAIVVVAGMEGALASVVGGLCRRPVIAVPTSIGYGASFGGLAALLGMLNACAATVTVVNIDNGFGAGATAHLINAQSRDLNE
jgi:NCAIR mutase (PurE)-related protein